MAERVEVAVGLMGFGRIGRNVFRLLADDELDVGAIVDIAEPEALAYLLKYDSIYGRFDREVELDGSTLVVDGDRIPIVNAREPGEVDWAELGVSTVVQATGKYRTAAWCCRHLAQGASRVILASTPEVPGDMPILLRGINDEVLTAQTEIIAMGSNTSNALAPLLQILDDSFGIARMYFTTVHAYTNKERLGDVPTDDFRSSRAAGENIIPAPKHPDVVSAHGQRAIAQGHLLVEGAHHGVVAQKVGEHVVIGQVVDGRDLDVRVGPLEDDAKNRPSDAPESVDGHPGAHEGRVASAVRRGRGCVPACHAGRTACLRPLHGRRLRGWHLCLKGRKQTVDRRESGVVAHQPDPPDGAVQRTQAGPDLDAVIVEQPAANRRFLVDEIPGELDRCELRSPVMLVDQRFHPDLRQALDSGHRLVSSEWTKLNQMRLAAWTGIGRSTSRTRS